MTLSRLGPVCGLLFAPLYAGFTFFSFELPEHTYSDDQVLAIYDDGAPFALGGALIALAGAAFLVFLAELHRRLRSAAPGGMPTLALGGGLLYVAMLFVAGTMWTGYANAGGGPLENLPDQFADSATLARVLSGMGWGMLLVYGLIAAAVMIAAASAAARRNGALPRGIVAAGFVVAPLLLAGFAWIPQFIVPLWVFAVGVSLLRPPGPKAVADRLEAAPAA